MEPAQAEPAQAEPALLIRAHGQVTVFTLNRPGRLKAIGSDVLGPLAAISYEGESVSMLFGTADRVAGLEAFRQRRHPVFTGH